MEIILLKMGEMVLKGLNRQRFEANFLRSIKSRIAEFGEFSVSANQSTVYVSPADGSSANGSSANGSPNIEGAFDALLRVFGAVNVVRAIKTEKDINAMCEVIPQFTALETAKTFKAESRRADKKFPLKSPQISALIGERTLENFPHLTVDVKTPEEIIWAEVRENYSYLHLRPTPGAGGLPVGTAGKAVLLLSGGIDSPVAGWRMARRGLSLIPLHFYSYPYTSPEAKEKTIELARLLAKWTGPYTLHIANFTKIQEQMRRKNADTLFTILTRRSMMRIAQGVAEYHKCDAIVTGDSLGQVASQTMEAMAVVQQATHLPVLRPLVGFDKEEIVETARHIGTFETSILPYDDCCAVFTPKHPQTKPKLGAVLRAEEKCELEKLEEEIEIEKIVL